MVFFAVFRTKKMRPRLKYFTAYEILFFKQFIELNVGFVLSGVERSVEKAELDRSRPPHVVHRLM